MTNATLCQYPSDAALLESLPENQRDEFIKYMDEMDAEAKRRGNPYGDETLWKATGAQCWYDFFNDGISASAAMDEDQSYDD